jgi:DNA mismatch repair protein MutS
MGKSDTEQTPLMKQYWDIKAAHQDKILLFRMGDFFEIFYEDAQTAAPIMGVALTSRNKKSADQTPMCGVPHHSIAGHINRLLAHGLKVAICDQIEDPKHAKGIVKRAVTRILSPGMVFDPDTLDVLQFNYLAALDSKTVSFLEPTTGEAFYYSVSQKAEQLALLKILQPVEIIISAAQKESLGEEFLQLAVCTVHDTTAVSKSSKSNAHSNKQAIAETSGNPNLRKAENEIADSGLPTDLTAPANLDTRTKSNSFANSNTIPSSNKSTDQNPLRSTPEQLDENAPPSAQRLVAYALYMQGDDILKTLRPFEEREYENRLQLGPDVLRHLEVFKTYKGDIKGSLFEAINRSLTAGGSRLLKQWLCFPLRNEKKISERLDQIQLWLANHEALKDIRQNLRGVGDFERRLGKISHPNAHPRDLKTLASTLQNIDSILQYFPNQKEVQHKVQFWHREMERIFVEDMPQNYREGGLIQKGVSDELDELIELSTDSQSQVLALEQKEKELTQIPSLKIRYNNVFGYYIEVTHTHTSKVPLDRYQRKQTLTNAERYTTNELADLERKVVTARTRRAELEIEIYQQLKRDLLSEMPVFLKLAQFLNELDVVCGLAWQAFENNYCRPQFTEHGELTLKSSRHPVIEQGVTFVPNDIVLKKGQCLLLTGPNMAGKSTIMRQVAIAAILAQTGSFVPAHSALLPLYDRIFTRIGASDFLNEGLSTFMVEMKETAQMLKESTEQSLVILDEVGRGTSTYDGLSLAQSILEYLITQKKPMIFFATHYHELTQLSQVHSELLNSHMAIHEDKGQLRFLYTLLAGPAVRSYGIQVARLAGLPASVTKRAEALLQRLEAATTSDSTSNTQQLDLWSAVVKDAPKETLPETEVDPRMELFVKQVKELPIQTMTPLDALNKLAQLQQELQ